MERAMQNGDGVAVDEVSFSILPGERFTFVGPSLENLPWTRL